MVLRREELATFARTLGAAPGWLTCSADGGLQIPMSAVEVESARAITAACLAAAGLLDSDRVVVALNSDGAGVGVLWSEAASRVCAAATVTRPDGTRRLLGRLVAADATALVCTPTAARQIVDVVTAERSLAPCLRRIVLVGEIVEGPEASALAAALGCLVSEAWPDPVFGVALAWRDALTNTSFRRVEPSVLSVEMVSSSTGEWIVHPLWCEDLRGISYRSGIVSASTDPSVLDKPRWTTGDNLLARGRWLSFGSLEQVLDQFGVERWQLQVRRHGAGEQIELVVEGPSSTTRIEEALRAITPLRVDVRQGHVAERAPRLHDERGHHIDRRPAVRESLAVSGR